MGFGGDIGSLAVVDPPAALAEQERCDPSGRRLRQPGPGRAARRSRCCDVRTGDWVQFAHMAGGQEYEIENAAR